MMPSVALPNGGQFIAEHRVTTPPAGLNAMDEDQLRNFVYQRWQAAYEGKRAENARLKKLSLYYDGFHYLHPWQNRENQISNYCFSTVETVVPIITEVRPRPEIVPRGAMSGERIERLQAFAAWYQDRSEFDRAVILSTRDKCIYGWNINLISFDYWRGMPFPRPGSVFDYYPDPTARNEDELEYLFLAIPVSTERLKAWFPSCAQYIYPDNIVSHSYGATVQPFLQHLEDASGYDAPTMLDSIDYIKPEGATTPAGGTMLTTYAGESRQHGNTTMLFQLVVRDESLQSVPWVGTEIRPDGEGGTYSVPGVQREIEEPVCPNGWMQVWMTAQGRFLGPPTPLDPCYGGLPIVVGRAHQRTDRMWSPGLLDHVIPVQRSINRRNVLLNRALELSANPPVITDIGSGVSADQNVVEGGEILRINRGSDLKWLEYRGPSEFQFQMLQIHQRDVDTISGVHDVQQGQRPAGIEAAAAIRRLQEAAAVRVRGMEAAAQHERAMLLKKCLTCAGLKLDQRIVFTLQGRSFSIEPEELLDEYDVAFAQGSGTRAGREDFKEMALQLYQLQLVDRTAALEMLQVPERQEIAARMDQADMMKAALEAKAQAQQNGNGNRFAGRH